MAKIVDAEQQEGELQQPLSDLARAASLQLQADHVANCTRMELLGNIEADIIRLFLQ